MNDDFMADITGAMWADWGRGDLQLIKDMGGNTIRMYGHLDGIFFSGMVLVGLSFYSVCRAFLDC